MSARTARFLGLLRCTVRNWHADRASNTGAALAFYCAFSLAPLLVILLSLAATLLGTSRAYAQIGGQLTALFGPGTAKVLLEAVTSAQQAEGVSAMIISAVTLFIGSTTVLAALEAALERIWQGDAPKRLSYRNWVKTRVLSLAFILALGFLLLVSLTVSTGLAGMRSHLARHYAAWAGALGAVDFAASLLTVALLFALIYRFVPAHRLRWRTVLAGGILTAVLFDAGRWAIAVYLAQTTVPSAFGAAASFAALLLWLYYSAQIFLFGAEFTACLGGLRPDNTQAPETANLARRQFYP
jgi:membrane protein